MEINPLSPTMYYINTGGAHCVAKSGTNAKVDNFIIIKHHG